MSENKENINNIFNKIYQQIEEEFINELNIDSLKRRIQNRAQQLLIENSITDYLVKAQSQSNMIEFELSFRYNFKIGDAVIVINGRDNVKYLTGNIIEINDDMCNVQFENFTYWIYHDNLEKI